MIKVGTSASSCRKYITKMSSDMNAPRMPPVMSSNRMWNSFTRLPMSRAQHTAANATSAPISSSPTLMPSTPTWKLMPSVGIQSWCSVNLYPFSYSRKTAVGASSGGSEG